MIRRISAWSIKNQSKKSFITLTPGHQVEDVLQKLRLGCTGVSAEQDVDLGAELSATS
jgi:hypothetical protein